MKLKNTALVRLSLHGDSNTRPASIRYRDLRADLYDNPIPQKHRAMNPILIVLPILSLLMFDLGLTLRFDDFALLARRPGAVLVGLAGQLVVLPAIAFGLASLLALPPLYFVGLVLIACCPGGSSSNVFSKLAGGDVALSVTLTALSSIITLFTIPVILGLAVAHSGAEVDGGIQLPVGNLLVQNLVLMALPIALGAV